MPEPSLLQRLKERKLVQWALAYLCGAWVLVESTNLVVEQFLWPQIVGQVVTILAFFGFFVVLVIAWYHGEKGRQWVSGPELLIIALLLLISGGVLSMLRGGDESSEPIETAPPVAAEGEKPSIAVLPCANMSSDPADDYLASALHDEILLKLQKISSLLTIGRTSVMQYSENPPSTNLIASALGVPFVGECSVQRYGNQIRLIFQLLDGRTGGQIWAEDYDRVLSAENLFDIQSDIAQQVALEVGAVLTPEEQERIDRVPTEDLSAYEFYLLARNLQVSGYPGGWDPLQRAIRLYRRSIQADSGFSLAYAGLAGAYVLTHYWGPGGRAELEEAYHLSREAAEKAVSLDSLSAEALTAMAAVLMHADHDWETAERELRRAVELDPGYYDALGWLDDLLRLTGRYEEAVEISVKALEADPSNLAARSNVASSLWGAGRLAEAAEAFGAVTAAGTAMESIAQELSDVPEGWVAAPPTWLTETFVYDDMGWSYDEALGALMADLARGGASPGELRAYQSRWGGLDWQSLWEAMLDPSRERSRPQDRAKAHTRLGQREEAVVELRRAWERGEAGMLWVHGNPFFQDLEGYGPYEELMDELGLRGGE